MPDFFKDKKIVVMGLGRTGISVLKKLSELSNDILGVDNNPALDVGQVLADTQAQGTKGCRKLDILTGNEADNIEYILEGTGLVVVSPGVPATAGLLRSACEMNIPVWSELELAWRLLGESERCNIIAVTGTNGKTTVVNLLGKIFDTAGLKNVVCGNVGFPLIDTIETGHSSTEKTLCMKEMVRIVEVSSFQMEWTHTLKPKATVILNITGDHIDRHGSMAAYASLKLKLAACQDESDFLILNADDSFMEGITWPSCSDRTTATVKAEPQIIYFSLSELKGPGLFCDGLRVLYSFGGLAGKINLENISLKGSHNISNIMAAAAPALLFGVSCKEIEKATGEFKPPRHRMEYLGEINQIRCINDSKSTNPDSTLAAINDFNREITLILGGRDKGMDFSVLVEPMNKKVRNLILIGETAPAISALLEGKSTNFKIYRCSGLEDAVRVGFNVSSPGDVLLLSPACASMDMFKDYRERGDLFRDLVMARMAGRDGRKGK